MTADPFAPHAARPIWLVTLADLALLLLGFVVLVQATGGREAIAQGLRERFGEVEAPTLPVAATAVSFAAGTIIAQDDSVAWTRAALADPRVVVTITGAGDSGDALQAADRAAAVAHALVAAGLPATRLQLATTRIPGRRATLTLAFAGEPRSTP